MDTRLLEASRTGNVDRLYSLVRDNVLILDTASLVKGDNPLRAASMAGHVNFVKEVLKLRMEFAMELNQDSLSPLHIASARGDVDIVRELLKAGNHLCLVKGREERIPLHYTAIKGRGEVLKELVSACPDSIEKVTAQRETALHLAVKNSQFEAFKMLVQQLKQFNKEQALNCRDGQKRRWSNAGLTPLGILVLIDSGAGDAEIAEILVRSEATRPMRLPSVVVATGDPEPQTDQSNRNHFQSPRHHQSRRTWTGRCLKRDSPGDLRNVLLIVAALITAATYQAVLQTPGGLWQDDSKSDSTGCTNNGTQSHKAGQAILGTTNPVSYILFLTAFYVFLSFNTLAFSSSMLLIICLTHGYPFFLEVVIAMVSMGVTYGASIFAITPRNIMKSRSLLATAAVPAIARAVILIYKYVQSKWLGEPEKKVTTTGGL
ncbi:hypothetical protein BT93_E1601 [Corymbia citriodora subsp. variegata]|nr:hypothetical protein BT93_E1601 [Corymbia citriodora subsp. variegata]